MNLRCTICDAVLARATGTDRCPECGARAVFQIPTREAPRHAKGAFGSESRAWEFSPDGPVLRRMR
jgi:phage FluMu protein Com